MTFYQECFGGELTLQKVGDSPIVANMPHGLHELILHAALSFNELILMGSEHFRFWYDQDIPDRLGYNVRFCAQLKIRTKLRLP